MQPIEVIVVDDKKVSCDGGKNSSRHPLVYLNMGAKENIICPYCSRYFTTKKHQAKTPNLISEHKNHS